MAGPARDGAPGEGPAVSLDGTVFEDAYTALLTLGMSPVDARTRLDAVAAGGKSYKTAEDVINVIFRKE
jgi:Holliday junction DNA helicase RuvA